MSRADWQALVMKYCPKEKTPCNCGDAFYTNGICEHGCSTNLLDARNYIAGKIAEDMRAHQTSGDQ